MPNEVRKEGVSPETLREQLTDMLREQRSHRVYKPRDLLIWLHNLLIRLVAGKKTVLLNAQVYGEVRCHIHNRAFIYGCTFICDEDDDVKPWGYITENGLKGLA